MAVNSFDHFLRNEDIGYRSGASSTTAFTYFNRGEPFPAGITVASQQSSHTASGKVSLGGSATVKPTYRYVASGGLNSSGTATASGPLDVNNFDYFLRNENIGYQRGASSTTTFSHFNRGEPYPAAIIVASASTPQASYSYTASGGLNTGSTATVRPTYRFSASGGLNLKDAATARPTYRHTASGGLNLKDAAQATVRLSFTASGSLRLKDAVQASITLRFDASGGLSLKDSAIATSATTQTFEASGGLGFGGSAVVQPTYLYVASGGLNSGGSAVVQPTYRYTASGGLNSSDTATVKPTYVYVTSGGLNSGGSVVVQPTYQFAASGGLNVKDTSSVQPRYLYSGSGGIGVSESVETKPTYLYTASGGLGTGDSAVVQPKYLYNASGSVSSGGSSIVQPKYLYNASGSIGTRVDGGVKPTYVYEASGGLSRSHTSSTGFNLPYNGSGSLSSSDTVTTKLTLSFTPTGGLKVSGEAFIDSITKIAQGGAGLGGSAVVKPTYIYHASGSLSSGGVTNHYVQWYYSYEASGSLGSFRGELTRPFDIRMLPITGYWDLIEDEIAKAIQKRSYCDNPISEEAFLGALSNTTVREMITLAESWKVLCYLGNGIYDIEIDGRRMEVNTFVNNDLSKIPVQPVPDNIAKPSYNVLQGDTRIFLSKETVLSGLKSNSRVRRMLTSPDVKDWTAELVDGVVSITITTKGNQTVKVSVNMSDQAVDTEIPVVTSRTENPVFRTSSSQVLVPKESVIALLGPNSFLKNIPTSSWEVLGVNGTEVNVKLGNGLIFSVPLR